MRFLVDECAGPVVADWLRSQGHDVFSVYNSARGLTTRTETIETYIRVVIYRWNSGKY